MTAFELSIPLCNTCFSNALSVCVEVMYDKSAVYNYFNTSVIRNSSSGDAKNGWSCTSSLPSIFMETCLNPLAPEFSFKFKHNLYLKRE
jgi:hypothetical protein